MLPRGIAVVVAVACAFVPQACGGSTPGRALSVADTSPPLDCGNDKGGSKRAVHQFFAVLRSGDEERILDALARGGRFEWISVTDRSGEAVVLARGNRRKAAAAVADLGGLPIRAARFQNVDRPSRTMDFGLRTGLWDGRRMGGKGAIDCVQGRGRVLSLALPFRVNPD